MYQSQFFPKRRKHTLCFLRQSRSSYPITLQVEIDASAMQFYRSHFSEQQKISYVSFLIFSIAQVLKDYPEVNAYYRGGVFPRIIQFKSVYAKLSIDQYMEETRGVLSCVLPHAQTLSLEDIQSWIQASRVCDFSDQNQFRGVKYLHRLPLWMGYFLMARVMKNPLSRLATQGSFSVSALGHQGVDVFIPAAGGSLNFGMAKIKPCMQLVQGVPQLRPKFMLSFVFDHRVLDGALAAEVLAHIKKNLESVKYEKEAHSCPALKK